MRVLFIFLIFYTPIFSQTNYPKDVFITPLDIPMQLSGNFGELRPNHFHAGLDFKTQQREGLAVFAVGDGYVSRIKISPYGYGKAIYIDHPNGYTTVYGHLQKGYGKIEAYIKLQQYQQQSYEIDVFPKPGELKVSQHDTIGISGNTGGSEGPHLHFEVRDTKTEKAINPLYFGYDVFLKDTRKPNVTTLMVYPIDPTSVVNKSKRPVTVNLSLQPDGTYISEKIQACGRIGFGIISNDYDGVSYNANGIFKAESFLNGALSFGYQFDTFAFDEGRYINALIDFKRYRSTRQRVQKLFMKNPYRLSIIHSDAANGIVDVTPNMSQSYRIDVSDYAKNTTTLLIPIDYSQTAVTIPEVPETTPYLVKANTENIFEKANMSVFFPAHTFYEDFYLNFDVKDSVMTVHDDSVPVHSNFLVTIKDSLVSNPSKTFIASIDGKRLSYNSTKVNGNTFTSYTKNLGQFKLVTDVTPPRITIAKPIEGKWLSGQKSISVRISDELSGIKYYNGYLNGKWVLFEYDNKTKMITHYFDNDYLLEGKNDLKIQVSDNLGNSAIFETSFYRSQKK